MLMLISSDIYGLLEFFSFLIWFFYGLDIVALLVIKYRLRREKNNEQTKKAQKQEEEDDEENSEFKLEVCCHSVYPSVLNYLRRSVWMEWKFFSLLIPFFIQNSFRL